MLRLLNLGCGTRFCRDPSWTNIDFTASLPEVMAHDLSRGIPFPNDLFDAVYHSHLLEHFTQKEGAELIRECFRILRPEGILRVAVPDLEGICRLYLHLLEEARAGIAPSNTRYEWIKLEMYDQAVRTSSGGEMAEYLRQSGSLDKEFILSRIGSVGREILEQLSSSRSEEKAKGRVPGWKQWAAVMRRLPGKAHELLLARVLNRRQKKALKVGLFRISGEVHQVMYDNYSLRILLSGAGFKEVRQCSSTESRIPNWSNYSLDTDPDGFEHAPSSLYMEGIKPR